MFRYFKPARFLLGLLYQLKVLGQIPPPLLVAIGLAIGLLALGLFIGHALGLAWLMAWPRW